MIKTDEIIYRTRTPEEYDWLMEQLEKADCCWNNGKSATSIKFSYRYTCIWVEEKTITYGEYKYYKNNLQDYSTHELIEVSELMKNEEKENLIKTDKVIYRTRTLREYNWLMTELDEVGCRWKEGDQPRTAKVRFGDFRSDLCIYLENKKIFHACFAFLNGNPDFRDYEVIEVSNLMHPYKDTKGKPKLSLVPPQVLFDIAEVREYGNAKYPADGADNWKRVDINDYKDALLRHTMKYIQNPKGKDEESGIEHYKHMACNIAFICEMEGKDEQSRNM